VTLSGAVLNTEISSPANSLTQNCNGGGFSYTINKSSENTFTFYLKQTFNSVDSSLSSFTWTRDITPPNVSLNSPTNPNFKISANFSYTANETVTYQCKIDTASYGPCPGPYLISPTNGGHTFYLTATDTAGNITNTSYNWTQIAYNALAIYHLDSATATTDSSLYAVATPLPYPQTLITTGSLATDTSGASNFTTKSNKSFSASKYYSVPSDGILNSPTNAFTIEAYVKPSGLPSTTSAGTLVSYTLISKNNGTGNYGWELRLIRNNNTSTIRGLASGKCRLGFYVSSSSTAPGVEVLSPLGTGTGSTCSINSWYFFAITFNAGTVTFYRASDSGSGKTVASLGSASAGFSTMGTNTAPLRLGLGLGSSFTFLMDEVRISQTVRTLGSTNAHIPNLTPTGTKTGD
jgi:hypothetical protein